jgi:AcrR family transcriptional regulator
VDVFKRTVGARGDSLPKVQLIDAAAAASPAARKARGRPSKRAAKREDLINGATALFNARGISATSIAEIADALDLARATIYYYVNDRNALVFQCYSRACELAAQDLAEAGKAATGLGRVLAFIRLSLASDRPPVAVLSEINALDPETADVIRLANDRNTQALMGFIDQGMDDGSIRPCDREIVAQAIVGMLSWSQLLPNWSSEKHGERLRERTSACMIELLTNGVAVDRQTKFSCKLPVEMFGPKLGNIFDREESSSFKVALLLATASALFNRNGIEATSVDEIGAAVGLTKGAVYHYLDDKLDLVTQCYERSFGLYDQFVDLSRSSGRNGLESAMINAHLNIQAQAGPLSPLMPQPGFEALPEAVLRNLHDRANQQNKAVAGLLQDGIDQGFVRPCETRLTTHICAGAFGWIPKWLPGSPRDNPMAIADEMSGLILFGLRVDPAH